MLLLAGLAPAAGQDSAPDDLLSAGLQAEVESISPERPFWLAVTLAPRGDARIVWPVGEAAEAALDWQLSAGFSPGRTLWPAPDTDSESPVMLPRGGQILLQEIVPEQERESVSTGPYEFAVSTVFTVCRETCVDEIGEARLELPEGSGRLDRTQARLFSNGRGAAAGPSPWPTGIEAARDETILRLYMEPAVAEAAGTVRFLPRAGGVGVPGIWQQLERMEQGFRLAGPRAEQIDGVLHVAQGPAEGVYSVSWNRSDDPFAPVDLAVQPAGQSAASDIAPPAAISLWLAVLMAFAGGIILNLMPCVFPVLAMKTFAFVRAGTVHKGEMRADGLAYAFGILISFALVAGVLIAIRLAGQQVGWGFQLQNPGFILILIAVLYLVGLNFLGLFDVGHQLTRIGEAVTGKQGTAGSFLTGILAVVVATPCTAPFMAPAVGFALTQSPVEALLIFEGLGLGLAFPYLLLSFIPALARKLPKPGPWMQRLKQFLAFPVLATVVWLVWVLALQTGANGAAVALGLMLGLGFLVWLARISRAWREMRRRTTLGLATLAVLTLTLAPFGAGGLNQARQVAAPAEGVVEFSRAEIRSLRRQGRPIFLNVTAAWCITCIVQERLVLSRPAVQQSFQDMGIVYMEADWTNPDAEIETLLADFGRSGIPLYVFYPPDPEASPVVLPEVLTVDLLLSRLRANM